MKKRRAKRPPRRASDRGRESGGNLISRSDLAGLKGVTKGAVTHAARPGGPLHDAVRGRFIDRTHQAVRDWLATDANGSSADLRTILLRKREAEVERLESRNQRDAGLLISRALVQEHVFGLLQELNLRLLRDVPRSLASSVAAAVRTGESREVLEEVIQQAISVELSAAKKRIVTSLQNCAAGDRPPAIRERPTPSGESAGALVLAKFVARTRQRLRDRAAPKVLAVTLKEIARAACGEHWNEERFTEVMKTKPAVEAEALHVVAGILEAHVHTADVADLPPAEPES